jgi:hypothetical protein
LSFFINPNLTARAADPAALIVHPHAQRTGGNTMRNHVLSAALGKERVYCRTRNGPVKWRDITDRELEGFAAVTDHFDFGANAVTRPLLPIAVLRHPLYRAVSLYHFIKRKTAHRESTLARALDLEAFYAAASEANPRYYRNLQCRRVCGIDDARVALETIDAKFLGVGFTEQLDEFVGQLGKLMGWPALDVREAEDEDAARYDPLITPSFRDKVLADNAEDLALYEAMRNGAPLVLPRRAPRDEARTLVNRAKQWAKGVRDRFQ